MPTPLNIPWSSDLNGLALRHGERIAVDTGVTQMSYSSLNRHAHKLARKLLDEGIVAGTCVGIYLPNGIEAVWADYGVTLSGACLVHLNAAYTRDEIEWGAHLAPMSHIVTDRANAAVVQGLAPSLILCDEVDVSGAFEVLPPVPAKAWGRIIFSSGTTGKPKALVYDQGRRWLAAMMLRAVLPFAPGPGSRILLMTPYVHGASMQARAWLDYGGTAVLLNGVHMDVIQKQLGSGAVDAVFAPPTVLAKLTTLFAGQHFDNVRCVFTGTQTLTSNLYTRARALFGPNVRVTYGKSENVNPITVLDAADTEACFSETSEREGACLGWPAPGVEIRIGDGDEIHLRSQHMYIGHIDQTGFHAQDEDGWHRTGDLGRIDERGRLWLLGRMADVIKSGGYKIYPDEIEAALAGTRGCGEISVIALASDYWGEVIVAVSEHAREDENWTEDAQTRVQTLARYKHPRAYIGLSAFPRNPQGKLSRRTIRDVVLGAYILEDGPYPKLVPK